MIQGILLAAGTASRFGSNKLLHPLPDGTPLALAAARNLQAAVAEMVVVVPPQDDTLARLLDRHGIRVVPCGNSAAGMGASLACGIRARCSAQGWIVALADMPYIQPATILSVRHALEHGAVLAAPVYQQQRGHPAGFSRHFFDALARLNGDRGARDIFAAHAAQAALVECNDPGILADIDHMDDMLHHQELLMGNPGS